MAAEERVHDSRAANGSLPARKIRGRSRHGTELVSGLRNKRHLPLQVAQPGTSDKPTFRPSPTRPAPQSLFLLRSYGSNLPTSHNYINLSTRGSLPRRPAADMGMNRRDTSTWPSPGISSSVWNIRHRRNYGALRVLNHIFLLEVSRELERLYTKEDSSRISRRRLQVILSYPDHQSYGGQNGMRFLCRVPE